MRTAWANRRRVRADDMQSTAQTHCTDNWCLCCSLLCRDAGCLSRHLRPQSRFSLLAPARPSPPPALIASMQTIDAVSAARSDREQKLAALMRFRRHHEINHNGGWAKVPAERRPSVEFQLKDAYEAAERGVRAANEEQKLALQEAVDRQDLENRQRGRQVNAYANEHFRGSSTRQRSRSGGAPLRSRQPSPAPSNVTTWSSSASTVVNGRRSSRREHGGGH